MSKSLWALVLFVIVATCFASIFTKIVHFIVIILFHPITWGVVAILYVVTRKMRQQQNRSTH